MDKTDVGLNVATSSCNVYPDKYEERKVEQGADPGPCSPYAPRPYERALCAQGFYFPTSSQEALHVQRCERLLLVKEGSMGEKWPIKFSLQHATSTVSVGIFYMPHGWWSGVEVQWSEVKVIPVD
jgi:hypothetical protein